LSNELGLTNGGDNKLDEDFNYDKELWFIFKKGNCGFDCDGKHYIIGNPHTFTGRIAAYCPKKNVFFNMSFEEIDTMPITTEYWIKGYLSGNEPSPPVDEENDVLPASHEDYIHWEESIELFHKTGYLYSDDRNCEICGKRLLYSWTEFDCEDCLNQKK
jgi:hypothetical protein